MGQKGVKWIMDPFGPLLGPETNYGTNPTTTNSSISTIYRLVINKMLTRFLYDKEESLIAC